MKNYNEYKKIAFEAINDYNKHNYLAALEKFKKMSELNKKNVKIHEILVYIYIKLKDFNRAKEEFNSIKKLLNLKSTHTYPYELENLFASIGMTV